MKKKLLLAMFTIATVFSLVACGGDKETASKKEDTKKEESKKDDKDDDKKKPSNEDKDISDLIGALTGKDKVTPEPEPTEAPDPTEAPNATEAPVPTTAPEATEAPEPTMAPSVGTDPVTAVGYEEMVDNTISTDQFSFKITEIEANDEDKLAIKVIIENKSDLELYFDWNNSYVNTLVCNPYWSESVDPGETVEDVISFRYTTIEMLNITDVTSLHFELSVSDYNDWSADPILENTYVCYPQGKDNAVAYEYALEADDIVVAETKEATMAIVNMGFNEDSDYVVTVYLENNTDSSVMFAWDDCYLNDITSEPYFAYELAAGMREICTATFDADELAIAGITDVTKLEFSVNIYNSDDWSADHFVEDSFAVYPKGKDAAVSQVRAPQDTDIVLVDTDELSIVVVGTYATDYATEMVLYYENKLPDSILSFAIDNTLVNDIEFTTFNYDNLLGGKKGYTSVRWSNSDLEDAAITEITSVQLPIEVVCYDTWPTTEYVNETFTVNP